MPILTGLDIGGTKTLGVLIDTRRSGEILAEVRVPTPEDASNIVTTVLDVLEQLQGQAGSAEPVGVGLGLAGLVDREGALRAAPNLLTAAGLSLGSELRAILGRPVAVENDCTAAAIAEARLGAGRAVADLIYVALGTGVGGGVVIGGEVQRGAHGYLGEFGHMVVDVNGPRCPCGRFGCWERFASGNGLGYLARTEAASGRLAAAVERAGSVDKVRGEHVTDAARAGDADALALLTGTFAKWIAVGLDNLISAFDPELIVLGGGVLDDADLILEPVRNHLASRTFSGFEPVPIVAAETGPQAAALGAALSAGDLLTG